MTSNQHWQTDVLSVEDTLALAQSIGSRLKGGEVIELISDLGGGKTTFVRGLARGMGSKDKVHSPSFTLNNMYSGDRLTLAHFDFYRLESAGIMRQELGEVINDPAFVVAVEWPNVIKDVLPPERLSISLKPISETGRRLVFSYPHELKYLLPD
jgi:tRNA threonylcarbamoyladenosine biosynthesis protein TsaE